MCGRYACAIQDLGRWGAIFKVWLEEIEEKYNIAPSATVHVYTREGWRKMRWGLVPSWSKEPKSKYATFNARLESLTEKPLFRSAWKASRRCLIPVSGYYEWQVIESRKTPFYVTATLKEPIVFAGLWERWTDDSTELYSCTIITTAAQGRLAELHHRMPVMLEPHQADTWLAGSIDEALQLLLKPAIDNVHYYKVSREIGNPLHQGRGLIEPLA